MVCNVRGGDGVAMTGKVAEGSKAKSEEQHQGGDKTREEAGERNGVDTTNSEQLCLMKSVMK